jgi:hypothetical protein
MLSASNWFSWALLSAVFAALTAIFAKVGLQADHPDLLVLSDWQLEPPYPSVNGSGF